MATRKAPVDASPAPVDAAQAVAQPGAEDPLDGLQPSDLAEMLAEEEPLWLDPHWHADCPFPGYTGSIQYPPVMSLPAYRVWFKMSSDATDEDREYTPAFIFIGDAPRQRLFFFTLLHFQMARVFGDVRLEAAGRPLDLDDLDAVPVSIVAWLALTAKYWLDRQLSFRVGSR